MSFFNWDQKEKIKNLEFENAWLHDCIKLYQEREKGRIDFERLKCIANILSDSKLRDMEKVDKISYLLTFAWGIR